LIDGQASTIRSYYAATGQLKDSEWLNNTSSQQRLAYTYDVFGNLETQSITNQLAQQSVETYSYDNMHRLSSTSRTIPGLSGSLTTHFAFDAVGNIRKKTDFSIDSNDAYTYGTSERSAANGWAGPNAVRTVMLAGGP
ncbi:hypothetical protein, partial [Aliikangiella maris]